MKCDVFSSTINGTTMKLHTHVKHQKLRTPSNLDNSGMHFDQVMPPFELRSCVCCSPWRSGARRMSWTGWPPSTCTASPSSSATSRSPDATSSTWTPTHSLWVHMAGIVNINVHTGGWNFLKINIETEMSKEAMACQRGVVLGQKLTNSRAIRMKMVLPPTLSYNSPPIIRSIFTEHYVQSSGLLC